MSQEVFISLPRLGESIVSAVVVKWLKKEGDIVFLDEPLLEVSTDKVNSEIPAPQKGILQKILVQVDQEVEVGANLAVLQVDSLLEKACVASPPKCSIDSSEENFLSPAVLTLLQEAKIPFSELEKIPKTGQNNRLTKKDVQGFIASRNQGCKSFIADVTSDIERIQMSQMRKTIAENMVLSFYQAPHATLATTINVTKIAGFIEGCKQSFFEQYGCKLSFTAFVAYAIAQSIAKYPFLNSSLQGDTVLLKKSVNLGIAVSVDQAVIVPVISGCEKLSLSSLAVMIASLAKKAKQGHLKPGDTQGGSITLTNFGVSGIEFGIPIIKYPEVAIVGLGAVTKKVIVNEDNSIAIASVCSVSLTFDHRVLDGLYGCGFLQEMKQLLENFSLEDIALAQS